MKRGFTAIGIYQPKTTENMGTLWRSAYIFGVDFIFTIGARYKHQPTDTIKATKHIPLFNFKDWEDFEKSVPANADIIIVEQGGKPLNEFNHPERGIYLLGSEDRGIPEEYFRGRRVLEIESTGISSLNVSVAGSIVLYDRFIKLK